MKKKNFILILVGIVLGAGISAAFSYLIYSNKINKLEIANNQKNNVTIDDELKIAYNWLENSGEAESLEYQAYNTATKNLSEMVKQPSSKPKAVVLDIDETCLNNAPFDGYEIENNETNFDFNAWTKWVGFAEAKAIPGSVEFTQAAKKAGVQVFYVSGRSQNQLDATVKNLNNCGFADATESGHVLLYPATQQGKQPTFDQIEKNYDVIMYVGDQLTDMGHAFDAKTPAQEQQEVADLKSEWGSKYIAIPDPLYGNYINSLYGYSALSTTEENKVLDSGIQTFNLQTGVVS